MQFKALILSETVVRLTPHPPVFFFSFEANVSYVVNENGPQWSSVRDVVSDSRHQVAANHACFLHLNKHCSCSQFIPLSLFNLLLWAWALTSSQDVLEWNHKSRVMCPNISGYRLFLKKWCHNPEIRICIYFFTRWVIKWMFPIIRHAVQGKLEQNKI